MLWEFILLAFVCLFLLLRINLVFLFLNDMKFSGIFLPFVSFCYFTLGQQWIEVVNILEGVISLFVAA